MTAVILLVILSGSLETRALLKQLSGGASKEQADGLSSAPSCACYATLPWTPPPSFLQCLPSPFRVFFFHFTCLCLEAKGRNRCALIITLPHPCSLLSLSRKRQSLEFSLACPFLVIHPFYCSSFLPLSLHFILAFYPDPGQVQLFALTPFFFIPLCSLPMSFPFLDWQKALGVGMQFCCVASLSAEWATAATCTSPIQ